MDTKMPNFSAYHLPGSLQQLSYAETCGFLLGK